MIRQLIVIVCLWPLAALAQDAELEDLAARLASQARGAGKSVAVVKFTNDQGYDSGFSKYIADRLTRLLVSRGAGLQLQSHAQVAAVARQLKLRYEDELSTAAVKSLVGQLGVDLLVAGSFTVMQKSVTVDASILDGKTGNMVGAQSVKLNRQDVAELLSKGDAPAQAPPPPAPSGGGGRVEVPAQPLTPNPGDAGAPPPAGGLDARRVAIPAQTPIRARVTQNLVSTAVRVPQKIVAHLVDPISVAGNTVANPEAEVTLTVADAGPGRLRLHLETVKMFDGTLVSVRTNDYQATVPKTAVLSGILFSKKGQQMQMPPAQVPANSVLTFTALDDAPWH